MLKQFSSLILFLAVVFMGTSFNVRANDTGGNDAVVTVLQGTARIFDKGDTNGRDLKKGDTIKKDQEVSVAEKSRLEMRFPDGTVMRLAEKSRLKMSRLAFNKKTESKNVKVDLSIGKLWAKVKKLATPDSSVKCRPRTPLQA